MSINFPPYSIAAFTQLCSSSTILSADKIIPRLSNPCLQHEFRGCSYNRKSVRLPISSDIWTAVVRNCLDDVFVDIPSGPHAFPSSFHGALPSCVAERVRCKCFLHEKMAVSPAGYRSLQPVRRVFLPPLQSNPLYASPPLVFPRSRLRPGRRWGNRRMCVYF